MAGNIFIYTPIQDTKREKYFNHNIHKGKMPTLAGNEHFSVQFFFHKPRLFHLSTEKCTSVIRQKWTSKWLFSGRHDKKQHKQKIKRIFQTKKLLKNAPSINKKHTKKHVIMMDKHHVYMCSHVESIKFTAGNKTRLFPSPFHISISWFLNLAEALRNDIVTAFSTSRRSATEKNEIGGYVTVPCLSKMTQHNCIAGWLKN